MFKKGKNTIEQAITEWEESEILDNKNLQIFANRDIFQSELNKFTNKLLIDNPLSEEKTYILAAVIGEIGNNSFDHNLGSWQGVRGVVFGYEIINNEILIVIADRGQGVKKTLQAVMPKLKNDKEALQVAFTKIISGRAPESRGNGLKFVRQNVQENGIDFYFISGKAKAVINGALKVMQIEQNIQGCLAVLKIKL
jgi:anti-sigma regulatory factor (Ser/Thr protein kinase)